MIELDNIEKENIRWIEEYLQDITYEEIPQQFLDQLNKWFESISYIKSIVELKKIESRD